MVGSSHGAGSHELSRDPLYVQVAARILDQVLAGELSVGSRLESERQLSERFRVSRVVIREAMKILVSSGVVALEHGRGALIADRTHDSVSTALELLCRTRRIDDHRLLEVRASLEVLVARLAAERATAADIEQIRACLARMDEPGADVEKRDEELHLALAAAARNDLLAALMQPMNVLFREQRKRQRRLADRLGNPHMAREEHRAIVEAVAVGDTTAAERAMEHHMEQIRRRLDLTANEGGTMRDESGLGNGTASAPDGEEVQTRRNRSRLVGRRQMLGWTLLGVTGSAVLAACGQSAPPAATPTTAPNPASGGTAPTTQAVPATQAPVAATKPATGSDIVTVGYWYAVDSQDQAAIHTDAAAKFEDANPTIKIKPELVGSDRNQKLLAAFAAGSGVPDTFFVDSSLTQLWDAGMVLSLEDRFKQWKYADDMYESVRELARARPGTPLGAMPNLVLVDYMYYRADWLASAKASLPETYDQFLDLAKALHSPPDHYGYGMRGGDGGHWSNLGSILKGNGVQIVDADGNTDLDSADAIAGVDWFASIHTKLKLTQPSALTDKYPELYALYQGGKLALFQHGLRSWKIQADVLGDNASAFPFPRGSKTRWVNTGQNGTSVFKSTKNPDQAWLWTAYTAEPDMARRMSTERGSPATLKSLAGDPIYTDNRFYKAAMTDTASWGVLPSYHKNWTKMMEQWVPEFQRLLRGETTAAVLCQASAKALRQS